MLHDKRVWGNKCWAMWTHNNTKTEQQYKKKTYERTEPQKNQAKLAGFTHPKIL